MSIPPELIHLLTALASHLQPTTHTINVHTHDEPFTNAISSLNLSLNLIKRPQILDAALSLMCFQAPKICNVTTSYLVDTLTSVLSSSISCKVSSKIPQLKRNGGDTDGNEALSNKSGAPNSNFGVGSCYQHKIFHEDQFLLVGSLISSDDCPKFMEACVDVLKNLQGNGIFYHKLLHAVLRVATSASSYKNQFPLSSIVYEKSKEKRNITISKLHSLLLEDFPDESHNTLVRLLLWYLDPSTLKDDLSRILKETTRRPFLCLKKELRENKTWRSIIICLVTSPLVFIETRILLHNWFLMTGLAAVLDFRNELVSSVLEVLARPTWWGISMEVGLKLPFSRAFFSEKHHQLLATLAGPISCKIFLNLVQLITGVFAQAEAELATVHSDRNFKQTRTKSLMVDHNSTWSFLVEFPAWFYFATILLFCGKDFQQKILSKCTSRAVESDELCNSSLLSAAAKYLAWALGPIQTNQNNSLVGHLIEISRSWMKHCQVNDYQSQLCADTPKKRTAGLEKKPKKPKIYCDAKDCTGTGLWLKDFHNFNANKNGLSSFMNNEKEIHQPSEVVRKAHTASEGPALLFRKVPLGIFIGCLSSDDVEGCELLLHYAATGRILESVRTCDAGKKKPNRASGVRRNEESSKCPEENNERRWEVAGASLVFNLCDIIEGMSELMFEDRDASLDFLCETKAKAGRFLVNCIEKILRVQSDENGQVETLMDLHGRFLRWMRQGREVFDGSDGYDSVMTALTSRIDSLYVQPRECKKIYCNNLII